MEEKGARVVIIEGKPCIVPAVLAEYPDLLKGVALDAGAKAPR